MDFESFIRQNIDKSAREIVRGFRDAGGKIGNERALEDIRKLKKLDINQVKQDASAARYPEPARPIPEFKDFLKNFDGSLTKAIKEYREIGGHVGYNTARFTKEQLQSEFTFLGWRRQSYKYEYLVNIDGRYVTVVSGRALDLDEISDSVLVMFISNDDYNLLDTDFDKLKVIGYYLQRIDSKRK